MCQNEYLWSKGLTHHHKITIFNDPEKEASWKHWEQWENSGYPQFFSTLSNTEVMTLATFNLLSANASNFVKSY